jgi:hypothetical protein
MDAVFDSGLLWLFMVLKAGAVGAAATFLAMASTR